MKTEITLVPETEEEMEFVERLAAVREYGIQEVGMDKEAVAAIMAEFAAGAMSGDPTDSQETFECPECGTPVQEVTAREIGGKPIVKPCECEVEWSEIPPDLYLD